MKKYLLCLLCLVGILAVSAQKIGVVDTEYILQQMPSFKEAEKRLNTQIDAWQSEVVAKQSELQKKKEALESERILLVDQQIKDREKEISLLDEKLNGLLKTRFGAMGEMNTLRANLSKPFQDEIWNAIKNISEKNTLGIVLDKPYNNVLFLDKKFDYTEKVMDVLKIKEMVPKQKIPQNTEKKNPKDSNFKNASKFIKSESLLKE